MIKINASPMRNLDEIAKKHYEELSPLVSGRLHGLKVRQRDFIRRNLKEILIGKPKDLLEINRAFLAYCTLAGSQHRISGASALVGLKSVFNYKHFTVTNAGYYCGYDLASSLNVTTCPYCNRNYTVTVDRKKRTTRPDFDHFLPKKDYPLFGLSFYNLVPSCLICNRSVKNQQEVIYGEVIHPYEEGFGTAGKIGYIPLNTDSAIGLDNKFSINLKLNPMEPTKALKCQKNFDLFQLKEIYEKSHGGEISDIIRRHHISNGSYLIELNKAFPDLGDIEELYRIAFGNFYAEDNFLDKPLSKLTKDVVDHLEFINPVIRSPK